MIETDVNNPDSRLNVKFYQKEVENEFKTSLEGRPIYDLRDFIRIEVPGNSNTIIDTYAAKEHQQRFPIQWARYQNEKTDGDVQGTLLRDWPILTVNQAAELKHFKFYTVEQIATASDQQINSIGMAVGVSPFTLRDKAKAYLASAKDSAVVMSQAEELRKRDAEIEAMKEQLNTLLASQNKPKAKAKAEAVTEE